MNFHKQIFVLWIEAIFKSGRAKTRFVKIYSFEVAMDNIITKKFKYVFLSLFNFQGTF